MQLPQANMPTKSSRALSKFIKTKTKSSRPLNEDKAVDYN
jgi:hypothetical protein